MRLPTSRTLFCAATFAALAGLLVIGWRAGASGGAARARQATLMERRAQLLERERAAQAALAGSESVFETPAAPAPMEDPAVTNARLAEASRSFYDLISNDPTFQQFWLDRKRGDYALSFGPVYQTLGLSNEEVERLIEILAKRDADKEDLRAIAVARDLRSSDPALDAIQQQSIAERRASLIELLGEARTEQLEEYERTIAVRSYVSQTAGMMAVAGSPLSREQADRMAMAIASTDPVYAAGGPADMGRTNASAIKDLLEEILSPAQMTLYAKGGTAWRSPEDAELFKLARKADREMFWSK